MDENKCWVEFNLTDMSKGLSVEDVQRAMLTLFPTPVALPKESPKIMTLEEFIKESKDEG